MSQQPGPGRNPFPFRGVLREGVAQTQGEQPVGKDLVTDQHAWFGQVAEQVAQLRDHARVSRVVDDVLLKVALVGGIAVSWLTIGSAHWLAVLLLGPQFSETGDICA